GKRYRTTSDAKGRFRLALPEGLVQLTVLGSAHRLFVQREHLTRGQDLQVVYYLSRLSHDPYHTMVHGERRREVTRISLRGRELTQVPGTFGDPFRVIQTLPGTASIVSLLPFVVVRGATPSSTGFLLDRTPVPLLYHLLAGPSVVHPEFIDEVDFFPGGAPALFGGYVGGIVNGKTRRVRSDERVFDIDVNLAQSGALVRFPVESLDMTITAAARYGYPGLLMSLATDDASLSYWDYQLRVDGGNARRGYSVFAFGARDALDTRESGETAATRAMTLHFHRLDLRAHDRRGGWRGQARIVLGYDESFTRESNISSFVLRPEGQLSYAASKTLTLRGGLSGQLQTYAHELPIDMEGDTDEFDLRLLIDNLNMLVGAGLYAEALWQPTPRWLIRPGLRADLLNDGFTGRASVDPRLTIRYLLARRALVGVSPEASGIWLKGAVGLYHQPPRFIMPLPGLNTMPLKYGLMRALQTSLGLEVPFGSGVTLSVEGFFSHTDPTLFDLTVNEERVPKPAAGGAIVDENDFIDRLTRQGVGRAYGLEVLLRRRARHGLYGWLAYTLSRSERRFDGIWRPYDFDRTHLLNLVAGFVLPRNWSFGVRFQYQSGRPMSSSLGMNEQRGAGFFRVDVRIDKRAVWRGWMLDFYVDLLNVALLPEELDVDEPIRYVIPTLGLRARF
ncbi:MAG: TonB-dependent receptor, partial [Deltaproteobacteria bacterium]|nr:TonB-dependent receptor [Deltaproteobacteria bacterium]